MKQSNYIIKSGDDATVWLTKRYEIYTLAKSRGIESYIRPNSSVVQDVNMLLTKNRKEIDVYIEALAIQTEYDEENLMKKLFDYVKDYPFYIYELNQYPVNYIQPTTTQIDEFRETVFVPNKAYTEYLRTHKQALAIGAQLLEAQALELLPSNCVNQYIGTPEQRQQANDTAWIPPSKYDGIIELEVKRSLKITRYHETVDDTIEKIISKLKASSLSKARLQSESSLSAYDKDIKRINELNGKILQLFNDSIEGVQLSEASEAIRTQDWGNVMDILTSMYTRQLNQQSSQIFLQQLMNIKLYDDETLQSYYEKSKIMVCNHQEVNQLLQKKSLPTMNQHQDLDTTECSTIIDLTDLEFQTNFPYARQYVYPTLILNSLVLGLSHPSCRLKEAVSRFRLKNDVEPQTVTQFFEAMKHEENILPVDKQIRINQHVEVNYADNSLITTSTNKHKKQKTKNNDTSKATTTNVAKALHCIYHSHNGQLSNHATADCQVIAAGKTMVDPNDPNWHVRKSNGEHYIPFVNNTNKKSTTNYSNTTSNNNNSKIDDGGCLICLNNSKSDNTITLKQIHSHTTAKHKVNWRAKSNTSTSGKPTEQLGTLMNNLTEKLTKSLANFTDSKNNSTNNKRKVSFVNQDAMDEESYTNEE